MFVFLIVSEDQHDFVLQEIESHGYTVMVNSRQTHSISVRVDDFGDNQQSKEQLEQDFSGIDGVLQVQLAAPFLNAGEEVPLTASFKTGGCRLIFDVDSTLTQGTPGVIHPDVENIFDKIKEKGIRIYLATGRSMPDLIELIKILPISKHSIAENGGIILGFPPKNYDEFGTITEPKKILTYLQGKYSVREDMDQGERFTEIIFLKKDVTMEKLKEAKSATGANVDFHESQNSFHVAEHGKNKGTAMLELAHRQHWGNDFKIAIGDAPMDIPMFEKADYSFAVGNCTAEAGNAASKTLSGKYEKGIQEIYEIIEQVRSNRQF